MKIEFDLVSLITAVGITQSFFLAVVIFRKTYRSNHANYYLGGIFVFTPLIMLYGFVIPSNIIYYLPHLYLIGLPFVMLLGPLFYFYVKELTSIHNRLQAKDLVHILPFLLSVAVLLPVFFYSGDEKIRIVEETLQGNLDYEHSTYLVELILFICFQAQIWSYLVIIWKMVSKHQRHIHDIFSSTKKINLEWIHFFIKAVIALFVLFLVFTYVGIQFKELEWIIDRLYPIFGTVVVISLGIRGLDQPEIFDPAIAHVEKEAQTYSKVKLSDEAVASYKRQISEVMEKEKLYLDPDLDMAAFAKALDVNRVYVSQVLNKNFKQNFYEFVNSYRISYVTKHLAQYKEEKINLLNLAFQAGFNSKTTFNTMFKKQTGMTPSQYWAKMKAS